VRELDSRRRFHVSHVRRGFQESKDGPVVDLGSQEGKSFLDFVNLIRSFAPVEQIPRKLKRSQ
jgi:hypothetical protein